MVPTRAQLEQMKKELEGWRGRLGSQKSRLIQSGMSEEEAQRAIDPSISYCLGKEEEIQECEAFYRMEENAKS